jgi:hypothetical protein
MSNKVTAPWVSGVISFLFAITSLSLSGIFTTEAQRAQSKPLLSDRETRPPRLTPRDAGRVPIGQNQLSPSGDYAKLECRFPNFEYRLPKVTF